MLLARFTAGVITRADSLTGYPMDLLTFMENYRVTPDIPVTTWVSGYPPAGGAYVDGQLALPFLATFRDVTVGDRFTCAIGDDFASPLHVIECVGSNAPITTISGPNSTWGLSAGSDQTYAMLLTRVTPSFVWEIMTTVNSQYLPQVALGCHLNFGQVGTVPVQ